MAKEPVPADRTAEPTDAPEAMPEPVPWREQMEAAGLYTNDNVVIDNTRER